MQAFLSLYEREKDMRLKDWAYLGNADFFNNRLRSLTTEELPPEKWSNTGRSDFGILRNYLYFTFEKLWYEREAAEQSNKQNYIYMDDKVSCFNTGLFSKSWQAIYFCCVKNPIQGFQEWRFTSFYNSYTIKGFDIPDSAISSLNRANYFQDPSALIFDVNLNIIPQWNHILYDEKNYSRIPEALRFNGPEFCQNLISGSIEAVKNRIEANYKTIVPQYYKGRIQLLAPLYLQNLDSPDLALVLSLNEDKTVYYGHTCLTTDMAYNNARLIARPESYWLKP